ncbi:hypothetical protein MRX96_007592 [Rhipicephalus microplus]
MPENETATESATKSATESVTEPARILRPKLEPTGTTGITIGLLSVRGQVPLAWIRERTQLKMVYKKWNKEELLGHQHHLLHYAFVGRDKGGRSEWLQHQ